jgi:hypothetical protein
MKRRSFIVQGLCAAGAGLLVAPRVSRATSMTQGISKIIEYTHWSGQHWTARLETIGPQPFLGALSYSDPDFHHVGPYPQLDAHDDKWIQYIAWDNQKWASQCHSHNSGSVFEFEHFRKSAMDFAAIFHGQADSDHTDGTLGFLAWDNSRWLVSGISATALQTAEVTTNPDFGLSFILVKQ